MMVLSVITIFFLALSKLAVAGKIEHVISKVLASMFINCEMF